MIEVASCQDDSAHNIELPFSFKFLDRSYNGNVFVSSNSFVTFGGSSTAHSDFGPKNPALPTLFIGSRDNAMQSLLTGPDPLGFRVRYEGWTLVSLFETYECDSMYPPTIIWELLILHDGGLQLCTNVMQNSYGISAVSDGISNYFMQKFALTPSTLYTISTGLRPCSCDSLASNGVKITSQDSAFCLKGRTPDMIDIRTCGRAGSANIGLPFPINFLGQSYGGQKDDIFVGDSSFVTFGGSDNTYYSSFEPVFSALPSLLIGARQNVLKTLSVGPDPLGWRVRYVGWSDRDASPIPSAGCSELLSSNPNITWEITFLYDGTLQLCTGSLLGNIDPAFDSIAVNHRFCTVSSLNPVCSNLFPNMSAVSAISDGVSSSFIQKFALTPSTLFTITTGVRPCYECDNNPQVNNGVKITSQASTSCLKGRTSDMIEVASCQDDSAHNIRLPFSFKFLDTSYSGSDIFVGSNSYVTFGGKSTSSAQPTLPSLLVGSRNNALRSLSVGPDLLGWRVRFEGWDTYLSQYRSIQCNRPANVIWELIFLYNNTFQLCTSSFMDNIDPALNPNANSAVWDGFKFVTNFSLVPSTVYRIFTGLPPCSLELSLSFPVASVKGSSLRARFPPGLVIADYGPVTLTITLQGTGFSSAPNTTISLVVLPPSSLARGTANILNSDSRTPVLLIILQGVANCSLVSLSLPSVSTPLLPQSSRQNVSYAVSASNQRIIFSSNLGSLEAIMQPILIDEGQPKIQLTNNAIRSKTSMNISLAPSSTSIPAESAPFVFVITLVGSGWSFSGTGLVRYVRPSLGTYYGTAVVSFSTNLPDVTILRVRLPGQAINVLRPLEILIFDVNTVGSTQLAYVNISSAIINSAGSVIAFGTGGILDAVVESNMGFNLPAVAISPPVSSTSNAQFDVRLTPQPQNQRSISLPAQIIISLAGSGFACSSNSVVKFISPFGAASGTASIANFSSTSILTIRLLSGTFLSGYPIWIQFGPCSNPIHVQPFSSNITSAMIDVNGRTVAASSSGTFSGIFADMDESTLSLNGTILKMAFKPRFMLPAHSFLTVSLTGLSLVRKDSTRLIFIQPSSGAAGTASITNRPLDTILTVSFSTSISARTSVLFSLSPIFGDGPDHVGNLSVALCDKAGNILEASASASFYSETNTATQRPITVQQLIADAVNGIIVIPDGIYAGRRNCNNIINQTVPFRAAGSFVELNGSEGRSVIDCSGTGMRCLIVRDSSIKVAGIVFKGGSSPAHMSVSNIAAIKAIFDIEHPNFMARRPQSIRTEPPSHPRSLHDDLFHFSKSTQSVRRNKQETSLKLKDTQYLKNHRVHSLSQTQRGIRRGIRVPSKPLFKNMQLNPNVEKNVNSSLFTLSQQRMQYQQFASKIPRRLHRRMLLSYTGGSSMFRVDEDNAGGCILVLAPTHSVSISGVSFVMCASVYGGGGFFDVSVFTAVKGNAIGNVARQGGGLFVTAAQRSEIEHFNFSNNTVISTSVSYQGENDVIPYFRMFSAVPDAAAAAGGGAWLQRLSAMKHCTFEDNLAMAALSSNFNDQDSPLPGAHALGSGMFVLKTTSGSAMSNLSFLRSTSLCTGPNCVSAGTLLIAFASFNSSIDGLSFMECHVGAVATMFATPRSEAMASCIAVMDASDGLLSIQNIHSLNCSVSSSGQTTGGCMLFPQYLYKAVLSRISVYHFSYHSTRPIDQTNQNVIDYGGIFAFGLVMYTTISHVQVQSFVSEHVRGDRSDIEGVVIYVCRAVDSAFISISVNDMSHRIVQKRGYAYGGMMNIDSIYGFLILNNISLQNSIFVSGNSEGSSAQNGFIGTGLYVYSRPETYYNLTIHNVLFKNVIVSCSGQCVIRSMVYVFFYLSEELGTTLLQGFNFQNISLSCSGLKCESLASIQVQTETFFAPFRQLTNVPSLQISDAFFENVHVQCSGDQCASRGACIGLSVRDGMISNIRVQNVTVRSYGLASSAGGAFLFHYHNNPMLTFLISNVTTYGLMVVASGESSTAIGGAVAAIYGNLTIHHGYFINSYISCSGVKCQSAGGACSFISSLGPSNKRSNHGFSVSLFMVTINSSVVNCSGAMCGATGGAVFAGVASRGPREQLLNSVEQPPIAPKDTDLLPLNIRIERCTFIENLVMSDSVGATLSGAGVSILLASATVYSSILAQNSIKSSIRSSFVAGAGMYVSGSNAGASIVSTEIKFNNAGDFGSGGGIFVGQSAELICKNINVEFNSAKKGGGLHVDGASLSLFSSVLSNNSATDKGGGLFCVVAASLNTAASLILSKVSVLNNFLLNSSPAAVGAAAYISGDVILELHKGTHFLMNGDSKYTTTEVVLSVGRHARIDNDTNISCKSGSVLSVARTEVENQKIVLAEPNFEVQFKTQCVPACLFVPEVTSYVASSGFLASCVPCPRGTYSVKPSSNTSDSVASHCRPCPFGALCDGGNEVSAEKSYWGWKVSESELSRRFMLLPPGYGCKESCDSISTCGGHRAGILCGECSENYSVAFFSTECVPSVQCASWKWSLLIFMCVAYQFLFTVWMFWSSESKLFQQQFDLRSESRRAIEHISLFQNVSPEKIDRILSKMELVNIAPQKNIITQGHEGEFMFIVKKGNLNVYMSDGSGEEHFKSCITAPNMVGELSLITGAKCAASVRTVEDCQLWKLDRSCLEDVAEEDMLTYIQMKRDTYSKSDVMNSASVDDDILSDAFGVLMWFYQLAGVMLSVTSPLSYIDGAAIAYSVVSFFVNSKPSSEAAADLTTKSTSPAADQSAADANSFQFCVSPDFNLSQVYISTFVYYVLWAFLMVILAHQKVWLFVRMLIFQISLGFVKFVDRFQKSDINDSQALKSWKTLLVERQAMSIEIRGPVILKWFITCFSALSVLMMQGTACFHLDGLLDAAGERRWIYDGRVACFSNSGVLPGEWQAASAIGVAVMLVAPACLWRIMVRLESMEKHERSQFQESALVAYSGIYASNARHWMVIM